MRVSRPLLLQSSIRLHDIVFPASGFLLRRTRLAFIHLENLISFAKRDRDGRVDGYFAGYLPDEVVLLFFRHGDLVTAGSLGAAARQVLPTNEALRRLKASVERGEGLYATADPEQLTLMYAGCAGPPSPRFVDVLEPEHLFPVLLQERFTGALEFISEGRVNYLQFANGTFVGGYLCSRHPDTPVPAYLESLFAPLTDGTRPAISGTLLHPPTEIPTQALPSQLRMYREVAQRLAAAVEAELGGDGAARSRKALDAVVVLHPAATYLRAEDHDDPASIAVPAKALTEALIAWTVELMSGVEILAPASAPTLVRTATKNHRHVLHAAGFYDALPWPVEW